MKREKTGCCAKTLYAIVIALGLLLLFGIFGALYAPHPRLLALEERVAMLQKELEHLMAMERRRLQ